jgi:hypothetical protein
MTDLDPAVLDQLACVRATGMANMYNRLAVQHVANQKGYHALYLFAQECGELRYEGRYRWTDALDAMPREPSRAVCPEIVDGWEGEDA